MEEQPPEILSENGKIPYRFFRVAKSLLETVLKYGCASSVSCVNIVVTEKGKFYCEFKVKKIDEVLKDEKK